MAATPAWAGDDLVDHRPGLGHVAAAAHLEEEAASGPQAATHAAQHRLVVVHPVQRGGREGDVEGARQLEAGGVHPPEAQVGMASGRALLPGQRDHARRLVHAEDAPIRDPLGDQRRGPAVTAADVEQRLVPAQPHLGDELPHPLLLRGRVGGLVAGVPVSHALRALISTSASTVRQFLVVAGVPSARSK